MKHPVDFYEKAHSMNLVSEGENALLLNRPLFAVLRENASRRVSLFPMKLATLENSLVTDALRMTTV